MKCPNLYAELDCCLTGTGFLHSKSGIGATELHLIKGHASHFPTLQNREFFFAYITDACTKQCTQVTVTGVDKTTDTLTISPPLTVCYSSQSRIAYDYSSVARTREIAASVGINVVSPLIYDCDTRTLSIDCQAMRDLLAKCKG